VKFPGLTKGRETRNAWLTMNERTAVYAVAMVAITTPTRVAKYAYFICGSIRVNELHLVVGSNQLALYKQNGRIILDT